MRQRLAHLALACVVPLAGCAAVSTTSTAVPHSLSGNWQIQSGSAITPVAMGAFYLQGALQADGSQVAGTFGGITICPSQPFSSYTGSVDSTGSFSLSSNTASTQVQLAVNADPASLATGTIQGAGRLCSLVSAPGPAVGVEIAPLSGTFAGTVSTTPPTPTTPMFVGNASLVLTQSATPNAAGQFPLTGTLTFSSVNCADTSSVSGTISGVGITLASSNPAAGQPTVNLAASTNPAASQLAVSALVFTPSPCSAVGSSFNTFTGILARE